MLTMIRKTRHGVAVLMLALAAFQSPLFASDTTDCLEAVLELCEDALEASRWWEKPAVGVFCSLMMAACGVEAITLSIT
ncbi:MAG: hypothetical protein ABIF09_05140 [Gemmatimonadota bacterium]